MSSTNKYSPRNNSELVKPAERPLSKQQKWALAWQRAKDVLWAKFKLRDSGGAPIYPQGLSRRARRKIQRVLATKG